MFSMFRPCKTTFYAWDPGKQRCVELTKSRSQELSESCHCSDSIGLQIHVKRAVAFTGKWD